ncbi:hypothetical protein AGMMS50268_37260 [Spirochaetia bacterium]|nr:hypothetical protein AGMMS50268_37260 [Spirochaetia bacterium]
MKTYMVNVVVLDWGDNLVSTYETIEEIKKNWFQDVNQFVTDNKINPDGDNWYPYFSVEEGNGDIHDLSFAELQGSAA